eukprot:gene2628-biopygen2179
MGTPSPCDCYRGLAAGTIDSYIGKLRTIFKSNGKGTSWNEDLHLGNPAAHHLVKDYISTVKEQQSIARVSPRQASPLFMDKLEKICNDLKSCILSSGDSPSLLYALVRDLAFFSMDFFSGNRASNLGRVKSMDVMISPDRSHVVFNQVVGKTLRGNGRHVFSVRRLEGSSICPVANLELYLHLVRLMTINLGSGFLFRPLDARGHITTLAFTRSTVANRLKKHMQTCQSSKGKRLMACEVVARSRWLCLAFPHLKLPLLSAGSPMIWSRTPHSLTGSSRFTTQDPGLPPKHQWAPLRSALTSEL